MPPYRKRPNSATKPRTIARATYPVRYPPQGVLGALDLQGKAPIAVVIILKRDYPGAGMSFFQELLFAVYTLLCSFGTLRTIQVDAFL